jgi:hypothetical protein
MQVFRGLGFRSGSEREPPRCAPFGRIHRHRCRRTAQPTFLDTATHFLAAICGGKKVISRRIWWRTNVSIRCESPAFVWGTKAHCSGGTFGWSWHVERRKRLILTLCILACACANRHAKRTAVLFSLIDEAAFQNTFVLLGCDHPRQWGKTGMPSKIVFECLP